MIIFTERLDAAIRVAARAHDRQGQYRKGSDTPYIIHPFGVMLIASAVTDDEDVLIACLMHDVLEDVDNDIYSEDDMRNDFGDRVVRIVLDVTKDKDLSDWHQTSNAYLDHLEHRACDEALIVSASDKLHNLAAVLTDYKVMGDKLWGIFSTKSADDQVWWYESILNVIEKRQAPEPLRTDLKAKIAELKTALDDTVYVQ